MWVYTCAVRVSQLWCWDNVNTVNSVTNNNRVHWQSSKPLYSCSFLNTFACKADSNIFEGNCLFQRQNIFSWFWYFVTLQEFPHLSWSKPCIGIIICNRFLESATYTCTLLVSLFEKWLLERILFPSHRQLVMCCVLCMWVLYVSSLVIEIYGSKARPHSTTNWSLINSWVKQTKFLSLNTVNTVSCCYSNSFNTWDTNMSMMVLLHRAE